MFFDERDHGDIDEDDFDYDEFDCEDEETDFDGSDYGAEDYYEPDFGETDEYVPDYDDIDQDCFRAYDIYVKTFYDKRPAKCTPVSFNEFYNWEWQDDVIRKHYIKLVKRENKKLNRSNKNEYKRQF